MKKGLLLILLASAILLGAARQSFGQWFLDVENGAVLSGYNDVEIPRDTGTRFSLSEDLTTEAAYFFRLRAGYQWKSRHTISVLFAPLRLKATGSLDREVFFYEELFPAGIPLTGHYKFNSYRLLEGGADVEGVYNFSLLHYLSAGLTFSF